MTKKELFKKAHELTRKMKAEFPDIDYRAQFSLYLKELHATNTNTKAATTTTVTNTDNKLLHKKDVTLNNVTRKVGIKIVNGVMFGVINNTKFIWNKEKTNLPIIDIKDKSRMLEASKLAIKFIDARFKLENEVM